MADGDEVGPPLADGGILADVELEELLMGPPKGRVHARIVGGSERRREQQADAAAHVVDDEPWSFRDGRLVMDALERRPPPASHTKPGVVEVHQGRMMASWHPWPPTPTQRDT
jgi:hypothetical protein